ncbi:MAG: transposase, partial [Verrucomicrobia bacterium]|nr:transposase [Verrucomicrobiota bacterium]
MSPAQWAVMEPLLPTPKTRGRPPTPARQILNAIFYVLRSGCQWRLLPKEFGPWQTVYGWFRRWRLSGVWSQVHNRLRALVRE